MLAELLRAMECLLQDLHLSDAPKQCVRLPRYLSPRTYPALWNGLGLLLANLAWVELLFPAFLVCIFAVLNLLWKGSFFS